MNLNECNQHEKMQIMFAPNHILVLHILCVHFGGNKNLEFVGPTADAITTREKQEYN